MIVRRLLLGLVLLSIVGAMVMVATPGGRTVLGDSVVWLRDAGTLGKGIAVGLVVVGIPLGLPSLWLAALLGYLFGSVLAIGLTMPAVLGGAALAFSLARWLFAEDVERFILRKPKWAAINDAVDQGGWKLIALLRLWAPHNLLNLALAATPVSLRDFLIGSLVGMLPSVALATLGGALAPDAAALWRSLESLGAWAYVLVALGVIGLVGAMWWIRRLAKRALDRARDRARAGQVASALDRA